MMVISDAKYTAFKHTFISLKQLHTFLAIDLSLLSSRYHLCSLKDYSPSLYHAPTVSLFPSIRICYVVFLSSSDSDHSYNKRNILDMMMINLGL